MTTLRKCLQSMTRAQLLEALRREAANHADARRRGFVPYVPPMESLDVTLERLHVYEEEASRSSLFDRLPESVTSRNEKRIAASAPPLVENVSEESGLPLFPRLLEMNGLVNPIREHFVASRWEVWTAAEPQALVEDDATVAVVVLLGSDKPVSNIKDVAASAADALKNIRMSGRTITRTFGLLLPVDNTSLRNSLHGLLDCTWLLEAQLRAFALKRVVRRQAPQISREKDLFVEPRLKDPLGKTVEEATRVVQEFVTSKTAGRLTVLLGTGGAGKTTLLAEAASRILRGGGKSVLLVGDEDWLEVQKSRAVMTPENLLKAALKRQGFGNLDLGHLDALVANGVLGLLFDSFDEVCSRGSSTSPNALVERILGLTRLKRSQTRVMLSARPSFWALVDPNLRQQCDVFTLVPFDVAQRDEYLTKRLGSTSAVLDRVRTVIRKVGGNDEWLTPLVLRYLCDAALDYRRSDGRFDALAHGINRANPLASIAYMMCEREKKRHDLPIDGKAQLALICSALIEFGEECQVEDFILLAQVEGLSEADAQRFANHHVLVSLKDGHLSLRNDTLRDALLSEEVVAALRGIAEGDELLSQITRRIGPLLLRLADNFGDVCELAGHTLAAFDNSREVAQVVWSRRTSLKCSPRAIGSLFRILCDVMPVRKSDGLRTPDFLEMSRGLYIARGFEYSGTLKNLDLSSVNFESCQVHDTVISSCRFSSVTSFRACVLVRCVIGEDCMGLGDAVNAFFESQIDDETISESQRYFVFGSITPNKLSLVALQRVLHRMLNFTGERRNETAFGGGIRAAEGAAEERALDFLRDVGVVSKEEPFPEVEERFRQGALAVVSDGAMTRPFSDVYRRLSQWHVQGMVH